MINPLLATALAPGAALSTAPPPPALWLAVGGAVDNAPAMPTYYRSKPPYHATIRLIRTSTQLFAHAIGNMYSCGKISHTQPIPAARLNTLAISENSRLLIRSLEQLPLLDGRYRGMTCVNANSATGETRGVFSLVFKAYDDLLQKAVAIKFFDIDPFKLLDTYRIAAFRREHELLQGLLDKRRCLQLNSPLATFPLPITDGAILPCQYFVVDWLPDDIDDYFERQDAIPAIEKLQIFNDIALSVAALHQNNIFHRDLKKDNFRACQLDGKRVVVAIDLGTAARADSTAIGSTYGRTVGAPAYAAPEAFCGLAGDRDVARYTDIYAMGCMLFELFNRGLFVHELVRLNPHYPAMLTAMALPVREAKSDSDKRSAWIASIRKHGAGINPVSILAEGHSVPTGVSHLLDDLVQSMTRINYRSRPSSIDIIRKRIQSALHCLTNEKIYQRRLAVLRERRASRVARIAEKDARLAVRTLGVRNAI